MDEAIKRQDVKSLVQLTKDHIIVEKNEGLAFTPAEINIKKLISLKSLFTLSITEINSLISQAAKIEVIKEGSSSQTNLTIPDAALIEPRGRFAVTLSPKGMLLEGKQINCFIPWKSISHISCIPSNVSTKKEGEELLAFLLSEPVKCNNKEMKTVLWNLSKAQHKEITGVDMSENSVIGTEHYVVSSLVSLLTKQNIVIPDRQLFQSMSESISGSKPYLKCYKGIASFLYSKLIIRFLFYFETVSFF